METIRLEKGEWSFDENVGLGPAGGFGEVFRGHGQGKDVAIKRLKLSAGAASHREMKIGAALAERTHDHVVPILDYGQDADSDRYYLVMPICDYSLQDVLNRDGPLPLADAKAAALNIAAGLLEVQDLVHRDLKPGNVLWHEGRWKIADFGIAKFVEDATSLQSLRTSLTPAYAAPEQWRGERPTSATDVYALGCIIFAMLTGRPPFTGAADDVREAHLHTAPPALTGFDPRLAGLIATMMRKTPGSRPGVSRCVTVLNEMQAVVASSGREALAAVASAVSQEEAAAEAARTAQKAAHDERRELVREAFQELEGILGRLFDTIVADAHTAKRERNAISLGSARLTYEVAKTATAGTLTGSGDPYQSGWESLAYGSLSLHATRDRHHAEDPGYYKFSVSLVFARIPNDREYRWREIAFHESFSRRTFYDQPFNLSPFDHNFLVAVSNVMGIHQVAHGPITIDGEDEAAFQERWLKLFAKAAGRRLQPPTMLPLQRSFFD